MIWSLGKSGLPHRLAGLRSEVACERDALDAGTRDEAVGLSGLGGRCRDDACRVGHVQRRGRGRRRNSRDAGGGARCLQHIQGLHNSATPRWVPAAAVHSNSRPWHQLLNFSLLAQNACTHLDHGAALTDADGALTHSGLHSGAALDLELTAQPAVQQNNACKLGRRRSGSSRQAGAVVPVKGRGVDPQKPVPLPQAGGLCWTV